MKLPISLKWLPLLLAAVTTFNPLFAQQGYRLQAKVDNYEEKKIYLATYYGSKTKLIDSTLLDTNGLYVFEGDTSLARGLYFMMLPIQREKKAIQFVVDTNDQRVQLKADFKSLGSKDTKVKGSVGNDRLYEYLRMLGRNSKAASAHSRQLREATDLEVRQGLRRRIDSISAVVREYQLHLIKNHPHSITTQQARIDLEPPLPELSGSEEEQQQQRYLFRRQHFFDYIDLSDSTLLRSPRFVQKIDHYLNKLTPIHPDSVAQTVDTLIGQFRFGSESHRFMMDYLMRSYEHSRYVGMDAVYVHLAERYYETGLVDWLKKAELQKVLKTAKRFKPILIGQKAPDITLQRRDGSPVSLYDIKSDYTVLFFWRPGCSYCKKATPKLLEIYEEYKSKGLEVFGLCTNLRNKTSECWTYVDDKQMDVWINATDSSNKSRFIQKYNAGRTPKIYVLDKDKTILMKNFKAENLALVLDRFIADGETTE